MKLWEVMQEKNAIYLKEDFSDEDGIRAAELENNLQEWTVGMPRAMQPIC